MLVIETEKYPVESLIMSNDDAFKNDKNLKAHRLKVTALRLLAASMPTTFNCDCIVSPVTATCKQNAAKKIGCKSVLKERWEERVSTEQPILTFPD
jgi:hypothetical protein